MTITLSEICRYPVKGLSAEPLEQVALTVGQCLPHDRRFALALGPLDATSAGTAWHSKAKFFNLMTHEKLAQLEIRFTPDSETLAIDRAGKQVVQAKIGEPMGRMLIGQFFGSFLAGEARGTPKLVAAAEESFTDCREQLLSIINLASVKDLERVARAPIDPRRFRGNLYLEGLPAWQEIDWVGQDLALGEARLHVVKPIERCAATNVNPETAARDLNLPLTLRRGFGHLSMGVYARVTAPGTIAKGDRLEPLS